MTWLELIGAVALVVIGASSFALVSILLLMEKQPAAKPIPRDAMSLYLTGKWYAERQEALAEEAVEFFGWDHDPGSPEAEICREVVLCGRHPDDAKQRLQEIRGTA